MKNPFILIHALRLYEGKARNPGGNFHHIKYLLTELLPCAERSDISVKVLVDELSANDLDSIIPPAKSLVVGSSGDNVLQSDYIVRRAISHYKPDLYYRPTGQLPFGKLACSAIMGVADLNYRTLRTRWIKRIYKEISYASSFRKAKKIICISNYTKDDVMRHYAVPSERISVIYHGSTLLPTPQPLPGITAPFWLTFGHQSHKNVELCLRALKYRSLVSPQQYLVVVGQSDHVDNCLRPLAHELGISSCVYFTGRVSAGVLNWLYQQSLGLLFMSKFEGFGLPVLEAMQAGCPVVASNVCSIPEVAGDAAILIDPDDLSGLDAAMSSLMISEVRSRSINKGKLRALNFSWRKSAEQTVDVMRSVCCS